MSARTVQSKPAKRISPLLDEMIAYVRERMDAIPPEHRDRLKYDSMEDKYIDTGSPNWEMFETVEEFLYELQFETRPPSPCGVEEMKDNDAETDKE